MKKNTIFIFVLTLILNLLPQTSDALKLSEDNNLVIYDEKEEQEAWEETYLPHAKHTKLVSKNTTMLDIAKIAQAEQEENISAYTIIHKIMDTTHHTRSKMLVKWERDNGYIDTEGEKIYEITPTVRRELLKEIEEEEEKNNQSFWNELKVGGKVLTTSTAFVVAGFIKKDIKKAWSIATLTAVTIATVIEVVDYSIKKYKEYKKTTEDEEIKIPPLRNMPQIPANHVRVDLYSL
jgi:hypothetical protein